LGKGSCFEFRLPANEASAAVEVEVRSDVAPRARLEQSAGLAGLRILVAEDSADNVMLLRAFLKTEGVLLEVARNGAEAVEIAKAKDIDLVLMDVQMPVLDGLEATRRLRSGGFKKPIIALTANALKEQINESLVAGCDAHLSKPVSRGALLSALRAYRST
jgi:CheY-like chemotaxis protein